MVTDADIRREFLRRAHMRVNEQFGPLLRWARAHEIHASDMHDDYNRGYGMACREVVTQIEKLLK